MLISNYQGDVLCNLARILSDREAWQGSLSGTGPVHDLEQKFKHLTCHRHALGMSNATLALWQVFEALNIHQKQVICSPITWGGMLSGALLAGNDLIFADVDAQSLNPTADTIRPLINKHTKALLLNDTFGYPCVGSELRLLAKEHDLLIIQDCSESFGAWIENMHTGAFADVAVFSLGPLKALSGSEGAVVVTSDSGLYEKLVESTQHPQRIRRDAPWAMNSFALNCRISAVGAAIACGGFYPVMKKIIYRRSHWQKTLQELHLAGLSHTGLPCSHIRPGYAIFSLAIAQGKNSDWRNWLSKQATAYRISPLPVRQPIYQDEYFRQHYPQKTLPECPVAEEQCHHRVQLIIPSQEEEIFK